MKIKFSNLRISSDGRRNAKNRTCLRCNKEFLSSDSSNRICPKCGKHPAEDWRPSIKIVKRGHHAAGE